MRQGSESYQAKERIPIDEIEEILNRINDLLEDEADDLKRRGFPVATDCRLESKQTGLASRSEKTREQKLISDLEDRFREKGNDSPERKIADLLEIVITLSINKLWFNHRLIAVRTNRYDDIINGVDTLIVDTVTGEPIAAVDEVTEGGMHSKDAAKIIGRLQSGVKVKYGFGLEKNGNVEPRSYDHLPIFMIRAGAEDVMNMAADLTDNKISQGAGVLKQIISDLRNQAERVNEIIDIPSAELRTAYKKAAGIFRELMEENA